MHSSMNDFSAQRSVGVSHRKQESSGSTRSLSMVGQDFSGRSTLSRLAHVRESSLVSRKPDRPQFELLTSPRQPVVPGRRRRSALARFFFALTSWKLSAVSFPRLRNLSFLKGKRGGASLATRAVPSVQSVPPRVRRAVRRLPEIGAADIPIILAAPLALVCMYLLFSGLLPTLEGYNRIHGVALPTQETLPIFEGGAPTRTRAPRSLAQDARQFEAIQRSEYVVRQGDTLSEIAYAHDLNVGTLLSLNPGLDVRRLLPGTVLSIPDRDGLLYAVGPGDSLSAIASSYGLSLEAILDANDLGSEVLEVGDALFLPGARMDPTQYLLAIGELFHWPSIGRFTSGYGMRIHPITGIWHMHTGVDIANAIGTRVTAARSGRVLAVESSVAYGNMIILDHGLGFRTLYGHLNSFDVRVGQYVDTGQVIGRMGNTGRSTGSHLHFSIIRNGFWEDPLIHLP